MNRTEITAKSVMGTPRSSRWSGLQFRLTRSYMLTTLCSVLIIEILLGVMIVLVLLYTPVLDDEFSAGARLTARQYALTAAVQVGDHALASDITFEPGQQNSIALPDDDRVNSATRVAYLTTVPPGSSLVTFGLVVATNGQVLASSYPVQFPASTRITQVLPNLSGFVAAGLSGTSGSRVDMIQGERVISAVEPIRNRDKQIIGLIYMQVPELPDGNLFQGFITVWLISSVFWLLIMLPVSGLFGWITTRGLLNRLHHLVNATMQFADGDYTHRVLISRRDEVGQLEEHFNRMAEQLRESTMQQQVLAAQNARMSERNRIARDLHDSVKQQVFTVVMQLGAALSLFDSQPPTARQYLVEAEDVSHHVQQELTTLIHELRPVGLQGKGLVAALRDYTLTWSRQQQIEVNLQLDDSTFLPMVIEEALWRVTQESLANIARHSKATIVKVALDCDQGKVILSITDNGCGFDYKTVSAHSIGLHSMEERMAAFGGTITVQSAVGQGTSVIAQCNFNDTQSVAQSLTAPTIEVSQ